MLPDEQIGGEAAAPPPKILILGVGNLLLGDDGFGVHLVNSLQNIPLPSNVTLLEAGTVSHQLLPQLNETDRLIVVDVVEAGDTPGALFRFSPDDMRFAVIPQVSLHQISLVDVLNMAALTGARPDTVIIGVQPKNVSSWSMELSDELRAVLPRVRELVFAEIAGTPSQAAKLFDNGRP